MRDRCAHQAPEFLVALALDPPPVRAGRPEARCVLAGQVQRLEEPVIPLGDVQNLRPRGQSADLLHELLDGGDVHYG